ncbi:hypothetical protein D3C80_2168220 [compost metagenome]
MLEFQVFDDDARLSQRTAVVHQHGKALEWPQRFKLRGRLRGVRGEQAPLERGGVLVERD